MPSSKSAFCFINRESSNFKSSWLYLVSFICKYVKLFKCLNILSWKSRWNNHDSRYKHAIDWNFLKLVETVPIKNLALWWQFVLSVEEFWCKYVSGAKIWIPWYWLRKLLANRGKSSARPVRLDGLQILAESRSSAANATFDKVRFIHKTNEFSLLLREKGLKNT